MVARRQQRRGAMRSVQDAAERTICSSIRDYSKSIWLHIALSLPLSFRSVLHQASAAFTRATHMLYIRSEPPCR